MTDTANTMPTTIGRVEVHEPQRRFELVPFDRIQLATGRNYLVKGLVPREGLVVVWGPPKCGKSFWTYDLVMHIALGWEYRGRCVDRGPVVYIACEGERGLGARTEAFRQRKLSETAEAIPFFLIATRLDLAEEHEELTRDIRVQIGDSAPVAIVIDTLNRSIRGSESRDEDMSAYVKACDAIREAFACSVVVIHHCGIESTRPRGHTSLTGAADAQIAVKRDDDGTITTELEFMKDGQEGEQTFSRLETIDVVLDEDGEPITSCVVVEAESKVPSVKLSDNQALAKKALANYCAERDTSDLAFKEFEVLMTGRGIIDGEPNQIRAKASKLRAALERKGLIFQREGRVRFVPVLPENPQP
jgi:hypothetical protein